MIEKEREWPDLSCARISGSRNWCLCDQRLDGIAGEGIIKDPSLSGSYMTGNVTVSVGMALALQIFVPGDPGVVLIDQAVSSPET